MLVRERLTLRRLLVTLVVLLVVLLVFAVVALAVGSERIGLDAILTIIASELTGSPRGYSRRASINHH